MIVLWGALAVAAGAIAIRWWLNAPAHYTVADRAVMAKFVRDLFTFYSHGSALILDHRPSHTRLRFEKHAVDQEQPTLRFAFIGAGRNPEVLDRVAQRLQSGGFQSTREQEPGEQGSSSLSVAPLREPSAALAVATLVLDEVGVEEAEPLRAHYQGDFDTQAIRELHQEHAKLRPRSRSTLS